MRHHRTAAAVALFTLATTAAGQETIENIEYTDWAKLKPGSSITVKEVRTGGGATNESVITITLVEKGADKLVLEQSATRKLGPTEVKQPAVKRDVPKVIQLPAGVKKKDLPGPGAKPPGTFEEGTETLKISGSEYKTKWYRYKTMTNGTELEGKSWLTDEVPGLVVKAEATFKGPSPVTTKIDVIEFKKAK